jgi:hypothetical protein
MALNFENIVLAAGFGRFLQSVPTLDYEVVARGCTIVPVSTGLLTITLDSEIEARFENVSVQVTPNPEDGSAVITAGALLSVSGGFVDLIFHDTLSQSRVNPVDFSFVIFAITNENADPVLVSGP